MKDTVYFKQANLVLDILPFVNQNKDFALKGGIAINFFIRDLPRLSVDIDLTYLPIEDRDKSLKNIHSGLTVLSEQIRKAFPTVRIFPRQPRESKLWCGLLIKKDEVNIKIEPNIVLRGSVFPTQTLTLKKAAQNYFGKSVQVQALSFADLYGGKICAALDRQHLRDLYDVKLLFDNEGFTDNIRKAFIIYLISHDRPMYELLNPNFQDIKNLFYREFKGMTFELVTIDELVSIRTALVKKIKESLSINERKFIISVKSIMPDWNLFEIKHIKNLPAVKWKLLNLQRMNTSKHQKP